jgi:hypothetical protein
VENGRLKSCSINSMYTSPREGSTILGVLILAEDHQISRELRMVYTSCALMWGTRLRKNYNQDADAVDLAEGRMTGGASASDRSVLRTSSAGSDATQSIREAFRCC